MEEVEWAVSGRETTLNKLVEQEKALEQSFIESVGENNKFKDFLLKVFRKKIKRAKRKQEEVAKEGEGEGEDEEGSEEESDSDYIRFICVCSSVLCTCTCTLYVPSMVVYIEMLRWSII